jgi:hypothetical protein
MNFFKALIGTCKGTKVFSDLLSQSLGKALLHLFLLALFCSFFITLCTYYTNSQEINDIFSRFGKLQTGKKGITVEKINETRSFPVDDNEYRISYLPNISSGKLPEIDADNVTTGFLWTPTMLTSWVKSGPDKFLLMPFAYRSDMELSVVSVERASILNYIKRNTSAESKLFCDAPELSWDTIKDYCITSLTSIIFFKSMGGILFQVLLFVMMFSFILNLSSKNTGAPVLKYKTRYIIGLYTSFPPLLIATIFRAFELPFLSFNSVYVLSFSIYLIVVFTQLQLRLNSGGPNKTEQQNV